jgi:hypothetical protein
MNPCVNVIVFERSREKELFLPCCSSLSFDYYSLEKVLILFPVLRSGAEVNAYWSCFGEKNWILLLYWFLLHLFGALNPEFEQNQKVSAVIDHKLLA